MESKNADSRNWMLHRMYADEMKAEVAPYMRGRVLDVGCGNLPYKEILAPKTMRYIGMDIERTGDVVGDALALPFQGNAFDTVVSFETMEHVREPKVFMSEIRRVVRAGGKVVMSTPFMWGEHAVPYDYFRYTRYGLRYLAEQNGFKVISIKARSGFWMLAAMRLNYYLARLNTKLLNPVFWFTQVAAYWLDKIDSRYHRRDTTGFLTILEA